MIHSGVDLIILTIPTTLTILTTPTIHRIITDTHRTLATTTAPREQLGERAVVAAIRGAVVGRLPPIVEACPVRPVCQQDTGLPRGRTIPLPQPVLREFQRGERAQMVFVPARQETQPLEAGDRILAQAEDV